MNELRNVYEIRADMPPPLELRKRAQRIKEINDKKIKKIYKSDVKKSREISHEPKYPLYHDLGETNMLENDMYKISFIKVIMPNTKSINFGTLKIKLKIFNSTWIANMKKKKTISINRVFIKKYLHLSRLIIKF